MSGDSISILHGGKVIMVLRPEGKDAADSIIYYKVIGPAYAHGFMDGQAMQWVVKGALKEVSFVLC